MAPIKFRTERVPNDECMLGEGRGDKRVNRAGNLSWMGFEWTNGQNHVLKSDIFTSPLGDFSLFHIFDENHHPLRFPSLPFPPPPYFSFHTCHIYREREREKNISRRFIPSMNIRNLEIFGTQMKDGWGEGDILRSI